MKKETQRSYRPKSQKTGRGNSPSRPPASGKRTTTEVLPKGKPKTGGARSPAYGKKRMPEAEGKPKTGGARSPAYGKKRMPEAEGKPKTGGARSPAYGKRRMPEAEGKPKTGWARSPASGKRSVPEVRLKRKPGTGAARSTSYVKKSAPEAVRLNKYIANAGICSRREADTLISSGLITVNNNLITELGTRVLPGDTVRYNGQLLKNENKVYILMNKPKDYITTVEDPYAKKTVMELIGSRCPVRVYPVGRLDRNTTGVLLLTNDGELAKKLTHPRYNKKKIYHVFLDKSLKEKDMQTIAKGIRIDEDNIRPDAIHYVDTKDKSQVGIEIHSGQNRIVRRIFESFGYRIKKLDRVYFAGLTKKGLQRGQWRFLKDKEVSMLKMMAFE